MKRFFFDLLGEVPAQDLLGREFSSRRQAREYACFLAHRLGSQHPHFAKQGNRILVRQEDGTTFYETPITMTRH
jgi:hypothetical protein